MTKGAYLKSGRLSDVLALIQVLALDVHAYRSEQGIIDKELGPPNSARSWSELGQQHPEFFRVDTERKHAISLVARHVLPHEQDKPRPALSTDFTCVLLQTAINLHDRQVSDAEWWKSLIPLGAALIGSLATLITLWFKGYPK
jgi:hypothetical protein